MYAAIAPFLILDAAWPGRRACVQVVAPSDALALEGLRVLTLRREQSVQRECLRLESQASPEHHAQWCARSWVQRRLL